MSLTENPDSLKATVTKNALTRNKSRYDSNVEIQLVNQLWPSSALGFCDFGATSMTNATTSIVKIGTILYVYFDKEYAYQIELNDLTDEQKRELDSVKQTNEWPDILHIQKIGAKRLI